MMWNVIKFGDLYAIPSRNGLTRPSKQRGNGCKMVNMGELFAYSRIINPEMERVLVSDAELPKYTLRSGDLLFARQSIVLEGAGKCSIVISSEYPTVFESHLIRVRLNKKICDPFFYFYFFKSQSGTGLVQQIVNQVSAAGIRGSDLEKLKIIHPPLLVQQKIAAILMAYDDLIEKNTRRIALLEKAAEEIYREWFVRMRFPGWENTPLEKGIPVGWQLKKLVHVCKKISSGGTPKTDEPSYWGGGIPWLSSGETRNRFIIETEKTITGLGVENSSTRLAKRGTIVIASAGQGTTRGQTSLLLLDTYINQSVLNLSAKLVSNYFLLFNLSSRFQELRLVSDAFSSRGSLTTELIGHLDVVTPPHVICSKFDAVVEPMIRQIENLALQNAKLSKQKDLLLPRLISGKLSVENLDIRFPPGMSAEAECGR